MKNVAVTATVSIANNESAQNADPFVESGISELSMASVILERAKSARHGVEVLGNIITTNGASEANSLMISDSNETWYIEIVSGHQYVGIKMSDDVVAVMPNIMLIGTVDINDKENVIASKDLITIPKKQGFLKIENNKIHVSKTYGQEIKADRNVSRMWQGVHYLNSKQAEKINIDKNDEYYDLTFKPSKKLSKENIMKFFSYRGEGTKLDSNKNEDIHPIGNNEQAECHIIEIRKDSFGNMMGVEWLAMSRSEFSVYIPFYAGLITDTWKGYKYDSINSSYDENMNSKVKSMYWVFAELNSMADDDREKYGKNIRLYWDKYQKSLIEQHNKVDKELRKIYKVNPELAQEKATEMGIIAASDVYDNAELILKELKHHINNKNKNEFVPTVLKNNVMPNYDLNRANGEFIKNNGNNDFENMNVANDTNKPSNVDKGENNKNNIISDNNDKDMMKKNESKVDKNKVNASNKSPKTGDESDLIFDGSVFLGALILLYLIVRSFKKEQ